MATLKLVSYAEIQLFQSSDLNGLTTTSYAFGSGSGVSSNVFDNTGNLYPEADVLISLGSFTPTAIPPYMVLAALWSIDGTNFPDPQSAAAPNPGTPIWTAGCSSGASAKLIVIPRVPLRPLKCKFMIGNLSGATLASSLNSVSLTPAGYTIQ